MPRCSFCGADAESASKFCPDCGHEMYENNDSHTEETKQCPFCDSTMNIMEQFCPSCGYEMPDENEEYIDIPIEPDLKHNSAKFNFRKAKILVIAAIPILIIFAVTAMYISGVIPNGTTITFQTKFNDNNPEKLKAIKYVIQEKLKSNGYSHSHISQKKDGIIKVVIPFTYDIENITEILDTMAQQLTFRDSGGNIILTNNDVEYAVHKFGRVNETSNAKDYIELKFTSSGQNKFTDATRQAASKASSGQNYIGIYLDDKCISSPFVGKEIHSYMCTFSGNFTAEQAQDIAYRISFTALEPVMISAETKGIDSYIQNFFSIFHKQDYVELIKKDSPNGYDMTYETMFNKRLSNVKWKYNSSAEEVLVIGNAGNMICKFVFSINSVGGNEFYYQLTSANIGGVPYTGPEASTLVFDMFNETYELKQ